MRGKQKELIEVAKGKFTSWKCLSKKLNLSQTYLRNELRHEKSTLDDGIYKKLCEFSEMNYDKFINEKLTDNWGQKKGGKCSPGNTNKINIPRKNKILAEFIGILLGDGSIFSFRAHKNRKLISVHEITVCGNLEKEADYIKNFILPMMEELFGVTPRIKLHNKNNEIFVVVSSIQLVRFLSDMGLKPGNKIRNKSDIPDWIKEKKSFLMACIGGLIDTDGSVFRMSKRDNLIRIDFRNSNEKLLKTVRESLIKLNYHPSKIICNKTVFLSRQEEIKRYITEIGFHNSKHLKRLERLLSNSPVV